MQVIGIGYNPKKIKTPPKSWDDLWDPKYKGRVGLTALNSQLGIAFLAELNRLQGRQRGPNFEPAFKALKELLPNVGAIGANLGAYATLWQQEQIDIAPYNFNFVQTLKGKDVPVELVDPRDRPGRLGHQPAPRRQRGRARPRGEIHRPASRPGGAGADAQAALRRDPDQRQGDARGRHHDSRSPRPTTISPRSARFDWEKLNPQRGALIERFNREIKIVRHVHALPRAVPMMARTASIAGMALPLRGRSFVVVLRRAAGACSIVAVALHGDGGDADRGRFAQLRQVLHRRVQLLDPVRARSLLGVKATLRLPRCSAIRSPGSARAPARAGRACCVFLVILPILTSVVVRTFSWIVILGRQGVLNQIALGLGLTSEPLQLLLHRDSASSWCWRRCRCR